MYFLKKILGGNNCTLYSGTENVGLTMIYEGKVPQTGAAPQIYGPIWIFWIRITPHHIAVETGGQFGQFPAQFITVCVLQPHLEIHCQKTVFCFVLWFWNMYNQIKVLTVRKQNEISKK